MDALKDGAAEDAAQDAAKGPKATMTTTPRPPMRPSGGTALDVLAQAAVDLVSPACLEEVAVVVLGADPDDADSPPLVDCASPPPTAEPSEEDGVEDVRPDAMDDAVRVLSEHNYRSVPGKRAADDAPDADEGSDSEPAMVTVEQMARDFINSLTQPLTIIKREVEDEEVDVEWDEGSSEGPQDVTPAAATPAVPAVPPPLPAPMRECAICAARCADTAAYRVHMLNTHMRAQPYTCMLCWKTFSTARDLIRHTDSNCKETFYKCQRCDRVWSSDRHHAACPSCTSEEDAAGSAPYACAVCGAAFKLLRHLTVHVKTHPAAAKPFKCGTCAVVFSTCVRLMIHARHHSPSKRSGQRAPPSAQPSPQKAAAPNAAPNGLHNGAAPNGVHDGPRARNGGYKPCPRSRRKIKEEPLESPTPPSELRRTSLDCQQPAGSPPTATVYRLNMGAGAATAVNPMAVNPMALGPVTMTPMGPMVPLLGFNGGQFMAGGALEDFVVQPLPKHEASAMEVDDSEEISDPGDDADDAQGSEDYAEDGGDPGEDEAGPDDSFDDFAEYGEDFEEDWMRGIKEEDEEVGSPADAAAYDNEASSDDVSFGDPEDIDEDPDDPDYQDDPRGVEDDDVDVDGDGDAPVVRQEGAADGSAWKQYHCPACPKKFRFGHQLNVHMRVHTGERPYRCKLCDQSFRQSNHLKRHLNASHGLSGADATVAYRSALTLKRKRMQRERFTALTAFFARQGGLKGFGVEKDAPLPTYSEASASSEPRKRRLVAVKAGLDPLPLSGLGRSIPRCRYPAMAAVALNFKKTTVKYELDSS